jgi:hypothetical protein
MKRMISLIIFLAAVITAVLFFINIKEKNSLFFYNLGFTLLFEALFIIWFGLSVDYKKMSFALKLAYFIFIIAMCIVQFGTLFWGVKLFNLKVMSKTMTTIILIEAGLEIFVSFVLFAFGNLFSSKE